MKQNKLFTLLAILVLSALLAVAFVACAPAPETQVVDKGEQKTETTFKVGDAGTVSVVIASKEEGGKATEYIVEKSKLGEAKTALEALAYFKANNGLTYTAEDSQYGAFLTQVDALNANNDEKIFINVYTSVESEKNTWAGAKTVKYKGFELYEGGVGVSSLSIPDGAIIYFTEAVSNY